MANSEHIKILDQGAKAWNKWRDENDEIKLDLSKAVLREAGPQRGEPLRGVAGLWRGFKSNYAKGDLRRVFFLQAMAAFG